MKTNKQTLCILPIVLCFALFGTYIACNGESHGTWVHNRNRIQITDTKVFIDSLDSHNNIYEGFVYDYSHNGLTNTFTLYDTIDSTETTMQVIYHTSKQALFIFSYPHSDTKDSVWYTKVK